MTVPLAATGTIDTGATAWMLTATALVLLMTPALGLFYAGLVRSKNTLNTFMMSISALGAVTVVWALVAYSLAFDKGNGYIGGLHNVGLRHVGLEATRGLQIPDLLFMAYQATFCIITAALISGAVVERMRFFPFLVFMTIWACVVYAPMAHWVWGGGWLASHGTLDWAGGVPVEMASGFSAFAAAIVVGARKDYGRQAVLPHNSVFVLVGAGLLWFGWFGFNGGSALNAGSGAVLSFTNTLLAPAATLVVWLVLDFARSGKATAIGAATAIIVGCVLITPAAGYVSPMAALLLGAAGALPSYIVIVWRPRTRLDETLDVLAAHGISGFIGILFVGVFADEAWNGVGNGLLYGHAGQLWHQAVGALAAPAYAFAGTYVLLRLIGLVAPLRVSTRDEGMGLDIAEHGEEAYAHGDGAILITTEATLQPQ
ncbi:MAG TPA: ammonium transporter [Gaiellaceae bacterium]